MNILSAALSLAAVIFEFIMLFVVKDLDLYGDETISAQSRAVELQPIPRPTVETAIDGKVTLPCFLS